MKQKIKKSEIRNLIKKVINESAGIPSEEEYYISVMVPRIKSWMDEVYNDWGGIDAVSPEALTDFSNRNDYEETLDAYAHEFNVDREQLRPVLNKAIEIAHDQLKDDMLESRIKESIKKQINNVLDEGLVDKFTPYTPEEKARNFEYLRTGFGRTPEERNPSYAKALKDAEERRRQRQMQKNNESVEETINYGNGRETSDNDFKLRWNEENLQPILNRCDSILNGTEKVSVQEIIDAYKRLMTIGNSNPIKYDTRLMDLRNEIKIRAEKLIAFVRELMSNRQNESKRQHISESDIKQAITEVLSEWKKSINEDHYSYNGLDQQAQYRKMGEDLMTQQEREKNYKKNITLFKRAYNKVYKEFTIIGSLKRKSEKAKAIFDGSAFMNFVKETEGDTLYNPIWEKYGGEYLEMANTYLESKVVKVRQ